MSKFDDRVLNLVQTVVDREVSALQEVMLDDAPYDGKADADRIMQKLEEIGNWLPKIKSEVKEIQEKLQSQEKKEEQEQDQQDVEEKKERTKRRLKKVLEWLRNIGDHAADRFLPDSIQEPLQALTDDRFFNEYGDTGAADKIENMVDNLITNLPLIIWYSAMSGELGKLMSGLKWNMTNMQSSIESKLGDIINNYLDDIKTIQQADHSNILDIQHDQDQYHDDLSQKIDDLDDQMSQKVDDLSDKVDDGVDGLTNLLSNLADQLQQCCQHTTEKLNDIKATVDTIFDNTNTITGEVLEMNGKMDSYWADLSDKIEHIPSQDNSQTMSAIANQFARRLS